MSFSRTQEALGTLRDTEGLGVETINHHVRAVKAFSRWLWKDGRSREHILAHLSTSNPESDRRHRCRALTEAEAAKLVQATETGTVVKGMSGPDRAKLYALALGTGFRAEELRTLTPERFALDANPPTVTVRACYSKNGKEAIQPLSAPLAERLRSWIAYKAPRRPVFAGTSKRTAEMIRHDLEAVASLTRPIPGLLTSIVCEGATSVIWYRRERRSRRVRRWRDTRPRA
jgi:integrase